MMGLLTLQACGALKWWGDHKVTQNEDVASHSMRQLASTDKVNLTEEVTEKLRSLQHYYTLGLKNLYEFDKALKNGSLEEINNSQLYFNLMAIRGQTDEIEGELVEVMNELKASKGRNSLKSEVIIETITQFNSKSLLASHSMENLISKLNIKMPEKKLGKKKYLNQKEIEDEILKLKNNTEFQVHAKNIEHLAHMFEVAKNKSKSLIGHEQVFHPSESSAGNITGNEFPSKVWSLTFDDGPSKKTSPIILKNLVNKNLKATFFQLTQNAKAAVDVAHSIRDAGMEIASHSYTHKDLTKVGPKTLEHEITEAFKELSVLQQTEIKFFRLPYGAGTRNSSIRQKLASNKLIHVFWNIDTLDWMPQDPHKIVERTIALMNKTKNDAGVILCHDIHQRTVEASPYIMDYLKKNDRRACTIEEIVTQINEGAEKVCPK